MKKPTSTENPEPKREDKAKIKITSKGQTDQKNHLQKILIKKFKGDLVTEKVFDWMRVPNEFEGIYEAILNALSNYRGAEDFIKPGRLLSCDMVCESRKIIIEYDERQHFTEARRLALECYKRRIKTDFDRDLWIKACKDVNAHDNWPAVRDETRAFYDSVRDIEARRNGYKLYRIMHEQVDFAEPDNADALPF